MRCAGYSSKAEPRIEQIKPPMEICSFSSYTADNKLKSLVDGRDSYSGAMAKELIQPLGIQVQPQYAKKENLMMDSLHIENILQKEVKKYEFMEQGILQKNEPLPVEVELIKSQNKDQGKKNTYNYNNQYLRYKEGTIKDKREKGIEPEYKTGKRDEKLVGVYCLEPITKSAQQGYDPLRETGSIVWQKEQSRKTLETMLYSSIAANHAYQSLTQPANVQSYIAKTENCTVALTEGYIKELNLSYLNLTVKNDGEEQNYQLLIRYQKGKERNVKAEQEIAEEIAKLSQKLSKKEHIDENEVMETLTATLKKKKLRLELTEEEIELVRQTKENEGLQKRIWLIDKKRKTFRRLEIESEIQQIKGIATEYRNPTTTSNYSENGNYAGRIERAQNDFTNLVPPKNINKFPVSLMGGVLGFTYLGDSFVGIRDDLNDHEANEVEIHEAIHTPDEYETRVITKWMLDNNTHYH